MKVFDKKTSPHFEVLRHPVFFKNIKEPHTQEWFKKNLWMGHSDHNYRKELISGDIYLEHLTRSESAISFFTGYPNEIANSNRNYVQETSTKIISNYLDDKKAISKAVNSINQIQRSIPNGGTLYSVCIPKEKLSDVSYFSRPFGMGLSEDLSLEQIEAYQNGIFERPDMSSPQVRLLTTKLSPESGIHILTHSTIDKPALDNIETAVEGMLHSFKEKISA